MYQVTTMTFILSSCEVDLATIRSRKYALIIYLFIHSIVIACINYNGIGVCHADDCSYYFRSVFAGSDPSRNSDEWKTIDRMCETFTTFARTGDPNNDTIAPAQWKPISLDANDTTNVHKYKCLNVSKEVSCIEWPELDRMQFWDRVYKQCNHNLI